MKAYQPCINGEFVTPSSPASFDVIDPSTCEVIARVPDAGSADVDRAVGAARAAFDDRPWKTTTAQDRGRILFKLAEIETRNSGKHNAISLALREPIGVAGQINPWNYPLMMAAWKAGVYQPLGRADRLVRERRRHR